MKRIIIAVLVVMYALATYLLADKTQKSVDEYLQTETGKNHLKIRDELEKAPLGSVILKKDGVVVIKDKMFYQIILYLTRKGPNDIGSPFSPPVGDRVFEFARSVQAIYPPDQKGDAARERSYLLDMFAQDKKIPPNWKSFIQ
jgi:hypothetical protein